MSATRSWTIGADPACDLVIAQDYVSGRHCRLTKTDSGVILEDLGSTNGTYVNGERIWSPRTVQPQDQITLGKLTAMPWPKELTGPAPPASNARVITVGRGPENDVVLDYPTVSTRHARVLVEGSSYSIEDLGSTNGTFLNSLDQRVTRSAFTANDTVYFGTQPIPAARLLPGVSAAKATVAINAQQMAAMVAAQGGNAAAAGKPASRPPVPPSPPATTGTPTAAGRSPWLPLYISGGLGGVLLVVLVSVLLGRGKPENSTSPNEKEVEVNSNETAMAGTGATSVPQQGGSGAPSNLESSGSLRAVYAVLA